MTDKNQQFYSPARTDGADIVGDMHAGQPDPLDNPVVPIRRPIERPPTIPLGLIPAQIIGDMVSGEPQYKCAPKGEDQVTGNGSMADQVGNEGRQ
jgi:hypothetical protein